MFVVLALVFLLAREFYLSFLKKGAPTANLAGLLDSIYLFAIVSMFFSP
jgi:hypothetical protein